MSSCCYNLIYDQIDLQKFWIIECIDVPFQGTSTNNDGNNNNDDDEQDDSVQIKIQITDGVSSLYCAEKQFQSAVEGDQFLKAITSGQSFVNVEKDGTGLRLIVKGVTDQWTVQCKSSQITNQLRDILWRMARKIQQQNVLEQNIQELQQEVANLKSATAAASQSSSTRTPDPVSTQQSPSINPPSPLRMSPYHRSKRMKPKLAPKAEAIIGKRSTSVNFVNPTQKLRTGANARWASTKNTNTDQ
ncbi:hypothetical protein MIR68_012270 [Amoeboaphelidium protococcarum]|nr:hypothetical protein MIR68_012270 [Amoeboaphelidium protococcarum]